MRTRKTHRLSLRFCQAGASLVELMVSITISSFLGLAIAEVYARQAQTQLAQVQRSYAIQDATAAFGLVEDLIRQAEAGSVSVLTGPSGTELRMRLPAGLSVWPNDVPPYGNNEILVFWDNAAGYKDRLWLAAGPPGTVTRTSRPRALVGDTQPAGTHVTGFTASVLPTGAVSLTLTVTPFDPARFAGVSAISLMGGALPRN